jgi:hypothetical protein
VLAAAAGDHHHAHRRLQRLRRFGRIALVGGMGWRQGGGKQRAAMAFKRKTVCFIVSP